MEYTSAGCLFVSQTHTLAGYQPGKMVPCISGIGGKREERDSGVMETALREMLEEVLGIYESARFMGALAGVEYITMIRGRNYVNIVYSFLALEKILAIVQSAGGQSPYYKVFPLTLNELIFSREAAGAEIVHFALLPLVPDLPCIDPYFAKDLAKFILVSPQKPS
jgi:hypothetical protein